MKHPAIRVAPIDAQLHMALLSLRVLPTQRDWVTGSVSSTPAGRRRAVPAQRTDGDTERRYAGGLLPHRTQRTPCGRARFRAARARPSCVLHRCGREGRGFGAGALAALLADLAERHPDARRLALTVNCNHHAALRLYLDAGFSDSGELYHGGRSGQQHLLLRDLP